MPIDHHGSAEADLGRGLSWGLLQRSSRLTSQPLQDGMLKIRDVSILECRAK